MTRPRRKTGSIRFGIRFGLALAGLVAVPLAAPVADESRILKGRAQIVDGDSLFLDAREIRLHAIDAPEWDQTCQTAAGETWACGVEATATLASLTADRTMVCAIVDVDRYKRLVGICQIAGNDVGAVMVELGFAIALPRYSRRYVEAEARARAARAGMWQGRFVTPAEWRKRK